LKSLWRFGAFIGYRSAGNDFYEARTPGWSFRSTERMNYNLWFESNSAKKYFAQTNLFMAFRRQFQGRNTELNFSHRYRFGDKFSLSQDLTLNPFKNDAGFYNFYNEDILISRRNRHTVENIIRAKYNFNNRSGITFRARHYWSKVRPQELFDLQADGTLLTTKHMDLEIVNQNFNIFNIDAVYTVQFAPGSFINIVWKNAIFTSDNAAKYAYFKNFNQTIEAPQNNNLSVKVLYYLDYLDFKKWRSRKRDQ
jgi:hypothetical protein